MVRFRPFNTIFEKQRSRSGCSFSHSALGLLTITVFELTGLGRGGQQVQQCKKAFKQAVELLVELASMQVRLFFFFFVSIVEVTSIGEPSLKATLFAPL